MVRKRRRRRKQSSRVPATLATLIAASVAITVVYFAVSGDRIDIDRDTFCPRDGSFPRTAILIDASDTITELQGKEVINSIRTLFSEQLATHEWVGIYVLSEQETVLPRPQIQICNPGSRDEANPLYENPKMFEKRYEDFFEKVEMAVEGVTDAPPQRSSPIFEMISGVAVSDDFFTSKSRRLLIVSDMLQNTDRYSHFDVTPDFEKWLEDYSKQRTISDERIIEPGLLREVDVQIIYVKRVDYRQLQTRGHIYFWEQYFNHVGARISAVKPI